MNVILSDEDVERIAEALVAKLGGRLGCERNRLLTYAEAAEMLGFSKTKVKELVATGRLRKWPGSRGKFALSEIQRVMEGGAA